MPIGWNPSSVMKVLEKQGGDECRPFYHPDFAAHLFERHIDIEMEVFAHAVHKDVRAKHDDLKSKTASAICLEASEAAFRVTTSDYNAMSEKVEAIKNRKDEVFAAGNGSDGGRNSRKRKDRPDEQEEA